MWAESCKADNSARKYPDNFCAYAQRSGAGGGDSGGPFICEENGFAILDGVHSGHPKNDKFAVIETYVFKHIEFIKNYMEKSPEPCC